MGDVTKVTANDDRLQTFTALIDELICLIVEAASGRIRTIDLPVSGQ